MTSLLSKEQIYMEVGCMHDSCMIIAVIIVVVGFVCVYKIGKD